MISRTQNMGDRAVVIGGSIAGLLAARVLADYFTEVIIDWGHEFYGFGEVGWFARTPQPSDLISVTCSRPLLEWAIAV